MKVSGSLCRLCPEEDEVREVGVGEMELSKLAWGRLRNEVSD